MKITFLKVAETELDDAFEYYESLQTGLGSRFLTEFELSTIRITQFPLSYEKIGHPSYSWQSSLHFLRDQKNGGQYDPLYYQK